MKQTHKFVLYGLAVLACAGRGRQNDDLGACID